MALSQTSFSLYNICMQNVAKLLKSNLWDIRYEFSDNYDNPFEQVPSTIIDELIIYVARISVVRPLRNTDLYHLIATGQVRNFQLEDINVNIDDMLYILMQLSSKCQNLVTIKLRNLVCSDLYLDPAAEKKNTRAHALECVLSLAPRLEAVESCIEFDLKSLRNAECLKQLRLNFFPKTHLFDFLEETNGQLWPNNSLKILEIFEDVRHPLSYLDIAVILTHCNELVEINCDISMSLEYLHLAELYNGTLTARYKLEKCNLGSIFLDASDAAAKRDGVFIAAITCPHLKEIDVLLNEDSAIYGLSDFQHLTSLLLQWESLVAGNFQLGTTSLLEKIGPNLKMFHIVNFQNVDFSLIGILCPNLEELRVEYTTEFNRNEFLPTSYRNIKILHLETIDDTFCQPDSLVGLISNCTNLKLLTIHPAEGLTDLVLQDILSKNSLSNLKEAHIRKSKLTLYGIQLLASKVTSLEYFEISSSQVSFDEIVTIVHEINPQVIMSHVPHI